MGLIDSLGRPKAPWFGSDGSWPLAMVVTDEGITSSSASGQRRRRGLAGEVTVELFARGERRVEEAGGGVEIPAGVR